MGSWSLDRREEVRSYSLWHLWHCTDHNADRLVHLGMLHVYEPVFWILFFLYGWNTTTSMIPNILTHACFDFMSFDVQGKARSFNVWPVPTPPWPMWCTRFYAWTRKPFGRTRCLGTWRTVLFVKSWWYVLVVLCTFQYRQHYEQTMLGSLWRLNVYLSFFMFVWGLNTRVGSILTLFFDVRETDQLSGEWMDGVFASMWYVSFFCFCCPIYRPIDW